MTNQPVNVEKRNQHGLDTGLHLPHFLWSRRWCRLPLGGHLLCFRVIPIKPAFVTCDSFIHLAVCLTTGPKPLPKRVLHIVQSRASFFKWEYPLLSLRSSSGFLRLLPCLPVTSILPCIFPSVTRCKRQFLCKMWPIQFAFRLRISCRIFLCSLTLSEWLPRTLIWDRFALDHRVSHVNILTYT
jgi:hypothetical protein